MTIQKYIEGVLERTEKMSKGDLIAVIEYFGYEWNMTNECCLCQEKFIEEKLGKEGVDEVVQRFLKVQVEFFKKQVPGLSEKEEQIRKSSQGAEQ